jgi:hypothetical protein
LAGKLAKRGGLYQGTLVGVGYILLEGFALVPALPAPGRDGMAESIWIIVADASLLAVAALAGWLGSRRAQPLFSADRGRDR